MKNRFEAHGKSRFMVSNNILLAETIGPWNKQGLVLSHRLAQEALAGYEGSEFGSLTIIRDTGIYTPDAEEFAHQAIATRAKSGARCVAFLYTSEACLSISTLQLLRLYNTHGIDAKGFRDPEEALQWLQERGFSLVEPALLYEWLQG